LPFTEDKLRDILKKLIGCLKGANSIKGKLRTQPILEFRGYGFLNAQPVTHQLNKPIDLVVPDAKTNAIRPSLPPGKHEGKTGSVDSRRSTSDHAARNPAAAGGTPSDS
jgi:hypothetical protein